MEDVTVLLNSQRRFYGTGKTRNIDFRIRQLVRLRESIIKNEADIMEALKKDLNKAPFEAYATEIGMVLEEINYLIKNIKMLAGTKKVRTPVTHFPSASRIYKEPYGIVLIMAPWNYPLQLSLSPLAGAIAAGNCMILKPSEYAPCSSRVIGKVIREVFPEKYIAVVEGGMEVNQRLLQNKFDYIFFTGSVSVGRIIMAEAAKHLTPVTLELGGKSPCIVDETANISLAAKRIVWGKFLNAGQTCVAPDYILVQEKVKEVLIKELNRYIRKFYGKDSVHNEEYPKIINERHFNRLLSLMKNEKVKGGGNYSSKLLKIEPTVLEPESIDSPIMQEEIFGPLLPVLAYENIQEAAAFVNNRPKPLALYLFTTSKRNERFIMKNTSFGGGCINDTIVHLATSHMGFGGVGESGMGTYHGKESFSTFSHSKSVLKKSNFLDIPLRYPPYKKKIKLLRKIL
ncbi:aldehyde dehydrogenase (NAD+) [Anaerocolumna jejuensis DSM 15929]|uniref:Aldehyde dehydrogenase n=1 Tax=Anaerocolumna jejuensis DSM 15929 TaxID=1121322 RepID=A0A1M6SSG7_9FIRM|nr:aldehyde dehydrogenase [Anaerocolumna jejuensis]SHK47570.1 aldehyde dehydrogenase (NAD+) [Anaerocolumna jejuensis DSM 15929]